VKWPPLTSSLPIGKTFEAGMAELPILPELFN
jgi:hypothetical protein